MNEKIIEIAAKAMKVTLEESKKHYKKIEDIDAYYFWNPVRGGIAVIVDSNGEKLAASSAVNFDKHLEEFKRGRRN